MLLKQGNLAFFVVLWYNIATFWGEWIMDMIFVLLMVTMHVFFLLVKEVLELVIDYRKF